MTKVAQTALAGLIFAVFAASCSARASEAGKTLAVTVSGLDCADAKSGGSDASRSKTAAGPAAPAITCALHGCTANSDLPCQLQSITHMNFAPCAGAVLISTHDILQHLLPDPTAAADIDSGAAVYDTTLCLAASCSPASGTLATTDNSSSTDLLWTDTFSLPLSTGDLKIPLSAEPSASLLELGAQRQRQPMLLEAHPVTDLSAQSRRDGWSAGDLLLVDLVLPAVESNGLDDSSEQQLNSSAAATAGHDKLDAATCRAGWGLWLARAGMVVFVGGLQLLPLGSRFLHA